MSVLIGRDQDGVELEPGDQVGIAGSKFEVQADGSLAGPGIEVGELRGLSDEALTDLDGATLDVEDGTLVVQPEALTAEDGRLPNWFVDLLDASTVDADSVDAETVAARSVDTDSVDADDATLGEATVGSVGEDSAAVPNRGWFESTLEAEIDAAIADADALNRTLLVRSGQTYTTQASTIERYERIRWEDGGRLNMADGSRLRLVEQS